MDRGFEFLFNCECGVRMGPGLPVTLNDQGEAIKHALSRLNP